MSQLTIRDAFLEQLREVYDAEKQLAGAMMKWAKSATSRDLRDAFKEHLEETEAHVERLDQVFEALEEKPRHASCSVMTAIIQRAKSRIKQDFDDTALDASLIATAQLAEHYEIAAYGSLRRWAKAMGLSEASDLLLENLNEDVSADENLESIAETISEQAAVVAVRDSDD